MNNKPEENTLFATFLTECFGRYQLLEGQFGHIYVCTICCPMPVTLQSKLDMRFNMVITYI